MRVSELLCCAGMEGLFLSDHVDTTDYLLLFFEFKYRIDSFAAVTIRIPHIKAFNITSSIGMLRIQMTSPTFKTDRLLRMQIFDQPFLPCNATRPPLFANYLSSHALYKQGEE